jgi:hypothetical protein
MSLYIDVDNVTEVLLADGWHTVADGSFDLDAYEYHHNDHVLQGGGNYGVCANGFTFINPDGDTLFGPLTAILAVKTRKERSA